MLYSSLNITFLLKPTSASFYSCPQGFKLLSDKTNKPLFKFYTKFKSVNIYSITIKTNGRPLAVHVFITVAISFKNRNLVSVNACAVANRVLFWVILVKFNFLQSYFLFSSWTKYCPLVHYYQNNRICIICGHIFLYVKRCQCVSYSIFLLKYM